MCENCNNCEVCKPTEVNSEETPTQLQFFDGWDEGSADIVSRTHNQLFANWEHLARERNL